jgi:hypothetical protein
MLTVPTTSTYEAPFRINDRNGEPLLLDSADIKFAISKWIDDDENLFEASESDAAVSVEPDDTTGKVVVTIPAQDVTWTGTVLEELRVSLSGESLVVSQRSVEFESVITSV